MSSISLPPIYLLTELVVEIDLIFESFSFSIIICVQFATLANFVKT